MSLNEYALGSNTTLLSWNRQNTREASECVNFFKDQTRFKGGKQAIWQDYQSKHGRW